MSSGGRLAQLRARHALQAAGLEQQQTLERASSVTNEVWMGDDIVIRVGSRGRRLLREARLAKALPPAVGYPPILWSGNAAGTEVVIHQRIDALPLAHVWADLDDATRRKAVHQVGGRLRALHSTEVPQGVDDLVSPQLAGHASTTTMLAVRAALDEARAAGVDPRTLDAALHLMVDFAPALDEPAPQRLIHGDLTFENVLWDGNRVIALLDLEYAAVRPIDMELEPLLRLCALPDLHVSDAFADRTKIGDFSKVPLWFREEFDAPFRVRRLHERLVIYAIGFAAWELGRSTSVPSSPPPGHPLSRLRNLVNGESYIHRFVPG